MDIVFNWQVSPFFGWGVYGLNFALELLRYPEIEARTSRALDPRQIAVDPLRFRALAPLIGRSNAGPPASGSLWLNGIGNHFLPESPSPARIGVVFFEMPLTAEAVKRANAYDIVVTGSSWNADILNAAGFNNTRVILQGVDRTLFYPAPKRNLFPGRFLIFSGGKPEPRKGQDIVVAAFRIFARRHPEAMLVAAWHTDWPQLARDMDLDLSALAARVIPVGAMPNGVMAPIYRECDVALFPNRAEGGTNLVAMECIACGVPTILSDCTGHRDLLRMGHGYKLAQKPSEFWSEWGESDVDEVVEALEWHFQNAKPRTDPIELPEWSVAADTLIALTREIYGVR